MRPDQEAFIEHQVGKPYRHAADGPDAFDCYGVPFFIYRELGLAQLPVITRPDGPACPDTIAHALGHHPELDHWRPVDQPADFDIALMANVAERRRHVGMAARIKGTFWIIHAQDAPVNRVILDDLPSLEAKGFKRIQFYRRS